MIADYTLQGDSPTVHKFYRDNEGNRIHETDPDFEPYFFIHADEEVPNDERIKRVEEDGDWFSNNRHDIKKVVAYSPKDVGGRGGLKQEFTETWESDVYFRTRYWLDEVPEDEIPRTDYRVCMYDIEVDHSLDAAVAPEEITCITAYDSYMDKYVSFLLQPPSGEKVDSFKKEDWSLYTFDPDDYEDNSRFSASEQAERDMCLKFLEFIKDTDPDIISAWNGETYDDPYLVNRMRKLKIDYSELSPINHVKLSNDKERVNLKGREMIDMIPAFQKVYFSELESYSLNNVGSDLLGKSKIEFEGTGAQLWRDNPEKLIEYNRMDVEIMVEIDENFDVWGLLREVQQWVGINLSDLIHNSRVCQAYFMRKMDARMPPKGYDEHNESFQGAKVLEETPGISENVAVLDLKAQYPSSMISYNMSPEMKIEEDMSNKEIIERFVGQRASEEDWTDEEIEEKFGYTREELQEATDEIIDDLTIEVGTGAEFWYGEMGTIPKVLIEMIQERDHHKELRDEAEPGSEQYEKHDRRQFALKFIINSVYGVMGHQKFPLYDRDVAKSTTFVGRETIEWAVEKAKELGYTVIYGDTDSIMISMGEDVSKEKAIEKAQKLEDFINERYDEYAKQNGVDTSRFENVDRDHFFEIEVEKLYQTFFMTRARKKYAGKIVWKEGKWVEDYDFAQFGKRSDVAKVSNDVVRKVLKMILDGKGKKEIQEYVTEVCNKIKDKEYDLNYIGIPSKMKKDLKEYETDRPVIRGTRFTNKHRAEDFGAGDKPKYVYVKRTPAGTPSTDVVCFNQTKLGDGYSVDYNTMIQKNIQQKLKRILNTLDLSWNEVYRTSSNLLDL